MKPTLILSLFAVSPLAAIPADTTLTLVNQPGFNVLTVKVDPGIFSDTDTTTLTGTVNARLDIAPGAGTTTELTLSNGRANGTNMTFSGGFGALGYNVAMANLSSAINTITAPGAVTAATGQFAASQHRFSIDQGTVSGTALGNPVSESFNPESPVNGTGTGTGTVTLTAAGDSGIHRTFHVTVTIPVAINDTFLAGTTNVAVTATGTVKATGTVQVPRTEYLAWTVDEGIPGAAFNVDPDGDGVSNGILWALGLSADADPLPYLPKADLLAAKGFKLSLPAGGTAAPIRIEHSDDLDGWADVPAAGISGGANPLPAGTTGSVTVSPDASPQRFVRLKVSEP